MKFPKETKNFIDEISKGDKKFHRWNFLFLRRRLLI